MLAKNWKKIGLIILIVACFANITSKLVRSVSFNDNVKSTVTNVINTVDGTVKNLVGGDEATQSQTTTDNNANSQQLNTNDQVNIISQPITVDPAQNQIVVQNNMNPNEISTQNAIVIEGTTNAVQ